MNTNEDDKNSDNRRGMWGTMRGQWGHHQGFGRAHFGQRGWLRPTILKLLEDKPRNGMEIINEFADASRGWWRPSPGSVYPLLEALEKEGLIKKGKDGRYQVTQKLRNESRSDSHAEEIVTNLEGAVSYLEEMAKSEKSKFSAYRERVKKLIDRLSKL